MSIHFIDKLNYLERIVYSRIIQPCMLEESETLITSVHSQSGLLRQIEDLEIKSKSNIQMLLLLDFAL